MRVDVVAAPVRYRRSPLMALLVIAVVPAAALFVAQDRLDAEADKYEASRDAVAALEALPRPPTSDGEDSEVDAGRAIDLERDATRALLQTSLIDYRRIPEPVADVANVLQLTEALEPSLGFVNDTSCIAVAVDGNLVASRNADLAVVPASTLKLVVAAVALEVLGSDHVFETTVASPIASEGVVDGDVYLVGGGDPLLTSDDFDLDRDRLPAFNTTRLDVLADAFVAAGITRINGAVVGDGSRYDDEWVVDGWGDGVAFDAAGPVDALLVNDSRVLGRQSTQPDPNEAAARELTRLLGNRGIRVNNGWTSGTVSADARVIGSVESARLSDVVAEMLTNSDNNTAEMLVKELSVHAGTGGTRAGGLVVIETTLRSWEVPMDGVRILDGSGLHLANRLTCSALLSVLQRSRGTALPTSLAQAARTGTLRDEFVDSALAGRLFAKTGTLGNPPVDEPPLASKALAGYVAADNGSTIEFALVINAPEITDEQYIGLWNAIGDRMATFPAGPDANDLAPR